MPSSTSNPALRYESDPDRFCLCTPVVLGGGGSGVVHHAFLRTTDGAYGWEPIALKRISLANDTSGAALARALEEAEMLHALRTEGIISAGTPWVDTAENAFCLPMELCEMTLGQYAEQRGHTFPKGFALALVHACLRVLCHVHARGFVHADIKPSNILITRRYDAVSGAEVVPLLRVGDLGLAQRVDRKPRFTCAGTPSFMAPECYTPAQPGPLVCARDVWSLGCTIHLMLTGQHPLPTPDLIYRNVLRGFAFVAAVGVPSGPERDLLRRLVASMLTVAAVRRPTAAQLLRAVESSGLLPAGGGAAAAAPQPKKRYARMYVCVKGRPVPVCSQPSDAKEHRVGLSVVYTQDIMAVQELCPGAAEPGEPESLSSRLVRSLRSARRPPLGEQRWLQIVYPVKGYCPSHDMQRHYFHCVTRGTVAKRECTRTGPSGCLDTRLPAPMPRGSCAAGSTTSMEVKDGYSPLSAGTEEEEEPSEATGLHRAARFYSG